MRVASGCRRRRRHAGGVRHRAEAGGQRPRRRPAPGQERPAGHQGLQVRGLVGGRRRCGHRRRAARWSRTEYTLETVVAEEHDGGASVAAPSCPAAGSWCWTPSVTAGAGGRGHGPRHGPRHPAGPQGRRTRWSATAIRTDGRRPTQAVLEALTARQRELVSSETLTVDLVLAAGDGDDRGHRRKDRYWRAPDHESTNSALRASTPSCWAAPRKTRWSRGWSRCSGRWRSWANRTRRSRSSTSPVPTARPPRPG